jgi:lipid-binding SYLF domain-containing protein
MIRHRSAVWFVLGAFAMLVAGCTTAPKSPAERDSLHSEAQAAITAFKVKDPSLESFFTSSYGYAIFPSVGKGAVGVGGAYGRGEVYEQGNMVGWCDLSQGTIGLQLGGQSYSELIFFKDRVALDVFKTGEFALAAQASAVAATSGASADADYKDGVVVFTLAKGGLMYEASIGGQKFSYTAK